MSGAEIEESVVSALFDAFYGGGREVTTTDIRKALEATVPLSTTMAEPIAALRAWCHTRARNASQLAVDG